jgi:4-azaleucine resistance transporter AzlC
MSRQLVLEAFKAALPICLGYIALGLPCGILGASAGMNVLQIAIMSLLMYSGSGQYMIAGMFLSGIPIASLITSVTLVNSRQLLYGSALSPFFSGVKKGRLALFAATVTDESFGVNLARFTTGEWTPEQAQAVNTFSHTFWIASNVGGGLLGAWLVIDTSIAAFAMTSIFLCLLMMCRFRPSHVAAVVTAAGGVVICKLLGFSAIAILAGALLGIAVGVLTRRFDRGGEPSAME